MEPDVSVIIPTYNRRAMVCEAIDSVLSQEGVPFELIVVDDGSTDGTYEELRASHGLEASSAAKILRVERTEHRGVAATRNRGAELASAPLLAFLDSDDLWSPGKLEHHVGFMRRNPEFAITQTQEIWIRKGKRANPGQRHLKRGGDIFFESLRTCLVSPSSVMMTARLFRTLGGFDEEMKACEDYDLWLRVLLSHEVGLLDEMLVTRRGGHPDQLSAATTALDRFRIRTLLKLVKSGRLNAERSAAVAEVLCEKCRIYAQGVKQRDNPGEAEHFLKLAEHAEKLIRDPAMRATLSHWTMALPPVDLGE